MMNNYKKILVVSDAYYPELSPRAFRTTELVRELAREGHQVTLVIPNRTLYHQHPAPTDGVTVHYAAGAVEEAGGSAVTRRNRSLRRFIPKFVQRVILYFYCHELFIKYNPGIYQRLLELNDSFDAVLSIAYPVAIHRAVSQAMKRNKRLTEAVCIAEFSDPPFRGDVAQNVFPAYYHYLKQWGRQFDYFTIPVEKALSCYTPYMNQKRIRIIPQGFDMQSIKRQTYQPHTQPTFAYGGRFYERIRDPKFFFDFLKTLDGSFRFDLYINYLDPYFREMIRQAQEEVSGEIVLHDALPREELIEQLSGADFLINFDNTTSNATPSKLIDYALTGRPVLSFNCHTFNPEGFRAALRGDYSAQVQGIDLTPYEIRHVAAQFLSMIDETHTHKEGRLRNR